MLGSVPLIVYLRKKDLGVLVDSQLKFHRQTASFAAKAN